ncbi:MAG: hypothetical protein H0U49_02500 [Parachlamydiaceae bacterium]|nr:hypothetical protein [Parachlamydiaceae bacterium]
MNHDSIQLDKSFKKLCNTICKSKNSELKGILLSALRAKPQLLEALRNGKGNQFKDL